MRKPKELATGLTHKGQPVKVTVAPTKEGGDLYLQKGHKRKVIPLATILANVLEPKPDAVSPADWVELATLENRLMVTGHECSQDARGLLFEVVRELRNERREDRGLPPVRWR